MKLTTEEVIDQKVPQEFMANHLHYSFWSAHTEHKEAVEEADFVREHNGNAIVRRRKACCVVFASPNGHMKKK